MSLNIFMVIILRMSKNTSLGDIPKRILGYINIIII